MELCNQHSKIENEVNELKISRNNQWDCLNELKKTKANTTMVTWIVGIFVILSLAVVGFLWRAQTSLSDKIESVQSVEQSRRSEIINKLDILNNSFIRLETVVGVKSKKEEERDKKH